MCTGIEKLRRAGDQPAIELARVKKQLAQAIKEKEAAELETQNTKQRCMCLTRNADFSNCLMCASLMIAFVAVGLLVYVWP